MSSSYSWFPISLLATLLLGVAMAFYKLPSAKNISRFSTGFWLVFTDFILAMILFFPYLNLTNTYTVLAGLAWGVGFTSLMLLQMFVLQHVETNVLFPLISPASLTMSILVGLLFFQENISFIQGLGIILVIGVVFSYLYKKGKLVVSSIVLSAGGGILFFSVFNKVLLKLVADNVDIRTFQIFQYLFATIVAFIALIIYHRKDKDWLGHIFGNGMKIGFLIGLISFFGGYALLTALTKGPFTLVISIHSLYIFVTAVTGYVLFKEQLTRRKTLLILVSIIAILLIRLG
jgi:glucose uptake protein GlcU